MDENKKQHEWILDGIDCANCANKVERGVAKVAGVANSNVNYMTQTLRFEVTGEREDQILSQVKQKVNKLEPDVILKNKADGRLIKLDTPAHKATQPKEDEKHYEWILDGIDCANCASKVERGVAQVAGVANSNVNFMTQTLSFEVTNEKKDQILSQVKQKVNTLEPDVVLKNKADGTLIAMSTKTAESESAAAEAVEQDNREDGEKNELRTAIIRLVLGFSFMLAGIFLSLEGWITT